MISHYDLSIDWHRLVPTYPSDKARVTAFVTEYGRVFTGRFWNKGACVLVEGHPEIGLVLDRNEMLPDYYDTIPTPLVSESLADIFMECAARDVQFMPVNVPGYDWRYRVMNILEWSSVRGEHKVFAGTTLVDESGGFLVNPVLFCLEEPLRSDAAIVMIDKLRWVLINSEVKHALMGKGLSGFEVKDVYVKRGM